MSRKFSSRILSSLLFLVLTASALAAPAGSIIEAQASATYLDAANQTRTTTSNMVVTVVQQVYGVSLTPDGSLSEPGQSRSGLPGSSVDLGYTVRNSGNVTDSYSLSTGLSTVDMTPSAVIVNDVKWNGRRDAGEAVVSSLTLAADASACVVISVTIPSDAAGDDEALVSLQAQSTGDASVSATGTWGRVVTSDAAVLTSYLLATPAGPVVAGSTIEF